MAIFLCEKTAFAQTVELNTNHTNIIQVT